MRCSTTLRRCLVLGAAMAAFQASPSAAQNNWTTSDDAAETEAEGQAAAEQELRRAERRPRSRVDAYVEGQQKLGYNFAPYDEAFTYSAAIVGGEAEFNGRAIAGTVNARYERRFSWGDSRDFVDGHLASGIGRLSATIVPRAATLEVGGLATEIQADSRGAAAGTLRPPGDSMVQVFSVFAGPNLRTDLGEVTAAASYKIGYTSIEQPNYVPANDVDPALALNDEAVTHAYQASLSQKPDALPFGWAVEAGVNRENISQLSQRSDDRNVRAGVSLPVGGGLSVNAGVGYEDVQVANKDALRDETGRPIVGRDGRYVENSAAPRTLAYDEQGMTWDAGITWNPSRRTMLSMSAGRRYGGMSYTGMVSHVPNERLSLYASLYDTLGGLGGALTDTLSNLSPNFTASRNGVSGNLNGCAFGAGRGGCFNSPLQGSNATSFRARGVSLAAATDFGRLRTEFAAGYTRRNFIAAQGTVLSIYDGVIDENFYGNLDIYQNLNERDVLGLNLYGIRNFSNGPQGDYLASGATARYLRYLTQKLSATAAMGVEGYDRDGFAADWTASALLGLRYNF